MDLAWTHDIAGATAVWDLVEEASRRHDASPFAHPAFLLAWLRTVEGEPRLGIVTHRDEVLGLLAMERRSDEPDALRSWGDGFDFATFHCREGAESVCAAAWLDGVELIADRVLLRNCVVGDPVAEALLEEARARGLRVDCLDRRLAPLVDLSGWPEGWEEGRTPSQRRQVRRSRARFARIPDLEVVRVDRPDGVGHCIDRFADLHVANFVARGRRSVYERGSARNFLRELATELASAGRFVVVEARDADGVVAVELILTTEACWYSLNSAWRVDRAADHPGTGILFDAIDRAAAAGARRYSFLEGEEHYKSRFATGADRLETWKVWR